MDTATFLKTILPTQGVIFVAKIKARPGHPKGDLTIQYPVADAGDAADKALELDAKFPTDNVYYAMASFKEVIYKKAGDFEYPSGRTQSNALNVKSLWLDWDVGKEGAYATRQDALEGIKQYLNATGLPAPIVVSSGYGIHTYWVFTEEVAAAEWESIAQYQRLIWRHLELKVDPACDKDCARVLRPPMTHNRKAGRDTKQVKVVRGEVNALPAMEYKRRLRKYCDANGLSAQVTNDIPEFMRGDSSNFVVEKPEFQKSYAKNVVQHCKQVSIFSETGGESEPLWYATLGVLKHCEDGEAHAHAWSSNHPGYDAGQTQTKLDQWNTGPTTCDRFKELNPVGCEGCQHKCKSPIQLGLEVITVPPAIDPVAKVQDVTFDISEFWPERFIYDKGADKIFVNQKNEETGAVERMPVATPLFYAVATLRMDDGSFGFRMHMVVRGKVREFQLPLKALAEAKQLKPFLVAQQIHVINKEAALAFLTEQMNKLRKHKEEIDTYQQLGWHHDGKAFLLGDTLITADQTIKVVMGKRFKNNDLSDIYQQSGSKEAWTAAVMELYGRENAEPYQLAIGNAFGSILNPLMNITQWKGIPYALTSDQSGYGKSTVFLLANSIYCKQDEHVVVTDSTAKGIPIRASIMNNIPFLLDEITKYLKDPADLSDLLYALSNGGARIGLNSDGTERERPPGWNGSPGMTGNRNILQQLTANKLNPEATQMRVFEVDLQSYPRIATMEKGTKDFNTHNAAHATLARDVIENHYGVIGCEWVRYVMAHRTEIEDRLRYTLNKLIRTAADQDGDATKERFYYLWLTCTLVGLYYARKLGYLNFDVTHLAKWGVRHIGVMRDKASECAETVDDVFSSMMADFVGKIIVTKTFEGIDGRGRALEFPLVPVNRSPVVGRLVLGDERERPKLYITTKAVHQWCMDNGVSYTSLRRDFLKNRIIRTGTPGTNERTGVVKVAIGKGVVGMTGLANPTCFEFDPEPVQEVLLDHPVADVAHLTAVAS